MGSSVSARVRGWRLEGLPLLTDDPDVLLDDPGVGGVMFTICRGLGARPVGSGWSGRCLKGYWTWEERACRNQAAATPVGFPWGSPQIVEG